MFKELRGAASDINAHILSRCFMIMMSMLMTVTTLMSKMTMMMIVVAMMVTMTMMGVRAMMIFTCSLWARHVAVAIKAMHLW